MKLSIEHFDIAQIAASGQCFRMKKLEDGGYFVIARDKAVRVYQREKDMIEFCCDKEEFDGFWKIYFDCNTDYGSYLAAVPLDDPFLQAAIDFGNGLRILKQDLWEMIVSFIISQNNNIPRIQNSIEMLCQHYGEKHVLSDGKIYYGFPSKEQLSNATLEDLRSMGLGYRDQYIYNLARTDFSLTQLQKADNVEAHKMLTSLLGIGPKVANCICLFGLYHLEAFPIDTWIRKTIAAHYNGKFPLERYEGFAGVIQQYMFYYGRAKKVIEKEKIPVKNIDNGFSM